MNELLSDVRFWFTAMGLGLLGFVKYLWNKQEKRLAALEATAVRKEDIQQLRDDMERRHDENRETLARIDASTTGTHKRIDQLYRDLNRG